MYSYKLLNGMLHVSSMLSEGEYCVKHSRLQYIGITHAHTHTHTRGCHPITPALHKKACVTYATSTVALLDKYNYNNLKDSTP